MARKHPAAKTPPAQSFETAMVLAAGLGTRMRPLSEARPKCLLPVAGRATLDRVLDQLENAGVRRSVVNLHYKGRMIERHLASRVRPEITFSDEGSEILDTGGGIAKALHHFAGGPFFAINAISLWRDGNGNSLARMAGMFDPTAMDALLLLHPTTTAIGYPGSGDFTMTADGRLARRGERELAPFVFTGAQILHPALFEGCPKGRFSLNLLYDRARAAGRLFGLRHEGAWMNLKTPDGLAAAERTLGAGG